MLSVQFSGLLRSLSFGRVGRRPERAIRRRSGTTSSASRPVDRRVGIRRPIQRWPSGPARRLTEARSAFVRRPTGSALSGRRGCPAGGIPPAGRSRDGGAEPHLPCLPGCPRWPRDQSVAPRPLRTANSFTRRHPTADQADGAHGRPRPAATPSTVARHRPDCAFDPRVHPTRTRRGASSPGENTGLSVQEPRAGRRCRRCPRTATLARGR